MTIKQRQHLLAYLGYYVGAVDGDWGSGSRAACASFQRDAGITADGYGGPETDKYLKKAVTDDAVKTEPVQEDKPSTGTFWDHIRYWSRDEFACRCGEYHQPYCNGFPVEPDQNLVEFVDDIRHRAGAPGHRSSGIRCSQHNIDSGGASNSKHRYGKALDFFVEGYTAKKLLNLIREMKDPRLNYAYEIDGSYVHVDVK